MKNAGHWIRRRAAGGLVLGLVAAWAGSPGGVRAADAPGVTTRSYDVRDFLVSVPDFYGPQFAMGSGFNATSDPELRPPAKAPTTMPTRAEQAGELMAAIRGSVAPETWREAGGTVGSMREESGRLVVTQTDENQRRVAELLELLRDSRAVQLTVQTRFLAVETEKLDARVRAALDASTDGEGGTFLAEEQVQGMLRELKKDKSYTMLTAPRLILFSGQTAYVLMGEQRPFVQAYARVEKEGAAARYEAAPSMAMSGVALEVQGAVSADRKSVTLAVRPRVKAVGGREKVPFEGDKSPPVDRPAVREVGLDTSVNVPTGRTVVLRMAQAETGPAGMTYVLLTPTVIVQKELPRGKGPATSTTK